MNILGNAGAGVDIRTGLKPLDAHEHLSRLAKRERLRKRWRLHCRTHIDQHRHQQMIVVQNRHVIGSWLLLLDEFSPH
jgi:hypothetical protein